jgi:peptidoglycan-N-acetylglucosamine deacetylase
MQRARAILLRVAMTVGMLAAAYLLLYGQPSGLEGGLILPYTMHVTGAYTILRWVGPGMIASELTRTDEALWRAAGIRAGLLRHPGGMQGPFLPFVALAGGWQVVVWSVDPRDYSAPGPAEIARRVLAEAHPGAIVLLHDGSPDGTQSRQQTVEALPAILQGLRDRGYRFVRIAS